MSEKLKNALVEAINDEYKARATYRAVINTFGEIRPFINIVEAEGRHVEALLPLFAKYNIAVPEDDWDTRIEIPSSILDACMLGVEDEIENAEMYDRLLEATTDYPDVQAVLKRLQRASKENHLPAFQRCVERGGAQGKGLGNGRGDGRGNGRGQGQGRGRCSK
ncbi:DUF2202 domain-containing protein [Neptuniibacter sp. 2_MG-2023]|uniref:ferritin-like domain-containing protein n=1 Tax=Neptuniibacter sp. 2_MG-2023 TaxID=3062671 RepID=UPI0026E2CED1|nr:DUF2202 domain-containing protein [Neptuniibacter sp. 2_MG-2023]MDO6514604.1 DUF2202 domain-containing protein [Neptuniibacter sp. 2_MG-2023]